MNENKFSSVKTRAVEKRACVGRSRVSIGQPPALLHPDWPRPTTTTPATVSRIKTNEPSACAQFTRNCRPSTIHYNKHFIDTSYITILAMILEDARCLVGWCRSILVFWFVVLLVRIAYSAISRIAKLPPGPWGFPILGYLPFVRGDLHVHFGELTRKYGSVFCTRLGSQLIVVLSDYKMIRDAFRKEEFTGRPNTEFNNILEGYGKSLIIF